MIGKSLRTEVPQSSRERKLANGYRYYDFCDDSGKVLFRCLAKDRDAARRAYRYAQKKKGSTIKR